MAGNSFHSPQLDVHLGPFPLCGLGTMEPLSTGHRGPLRVGERPEVHLFSHWPRLPLEGDPQALLEVPARIWELNFEGPP